MRIAQIVMNGGRLHSFTYFTIAISLFDNGDYHARVMWWVRQNSEIGLNVTRGHWFHNGCGNVKAKVVESGKWVCDKC
jgi:hypothetical protein